MESNNKEWRTRIESWTELKYTATAPNRKWKQSWKTPFQSVEMNGKHLNMETTERNWKEWRKEHLWNEACWIWDLGSSVTPLGAMSQDKWWNAATWSSPLTHKIRQRKKKIQGSQFLSKFEYSLSTFEFQIWIVQGQHLYL